MPMGGGQLVDPCPYSNSRTSATSPLTAAATTIAGLISRVRPLDDPWRPLKLRLEEEALIWLP